MAAANGPCVRAYLATRSPSGSASGAVYASAEVVGTEWASGRVAVCDAENGLGVVAFVVEDQQIGLGAAEAVAGEKLVLS